MLAFNPPPIFGLGTAGGFEFYIQNRGDGGPKRLNEVTQRVPAALRTRTRASATRRRCGAPTCRSSTSTSTARRRRRLGVPIDDVFAALSATLGTYYVNDFNKYGRTWQVLMSAERAVSRASRRHRRGLRALGQGRDGAAGGAGDGPLLVRPRRARSLQQPAGGQDLRQRPRRASAPARRSRSVEADREGDAAVRTSASTGAARRTRKSAPAARRRSRSASR